MLIVDHFIVFIITIFLPFAGYLGFRRLLTRLRRGVPVNRIGMYRNTLIAQWSMALILSYHWSVSGRTPDQLGLHVTLDAAFFTCAVVVLICVGVLMAQFISVLRSDQSTIDNLSQKFGRLALIVPHNQRELRIFYAVSVTAGIVEELLWRGYLMWYLTQYFSVGTAAIIVTLGFGLAHGYQGLRNIPKITLVGGAFTGLYLMTGSIWLSMFLHIAIDAVQGRLACEISQRSSYGLPERA